MITCKISEINNYTVATILIAEANLDHSAKFKEQLIKLIDEGKQKIVVSFDLVTYVDSSFLGALVAALKHAIANDAEIIVACLNKDVEDLFKLIRLDKVFTIIPNLIALA